MNQERAKRLAPIITAFGAGKDVEERYRAVSQNEWKVNKTPCFENEEFDFRIKPLEFPPLPEGLSLSNPDGLTPEQVGDGWRLLSTAECNLNWIPRAQVWRGVRENGEWDHFGKDAQGAYASSYNSIRIPASTPFPSPPKPKVRVPLDFSEIPCGAIIHWTKTGTKVLVTLTDEKRQQVFLNGSNLPCQFEFMLREEALISRDGGKTWEPCSKEG